MVPAEPCGRIEPLARLRGSPLRLPHIQVSQSPPPGVVACQAVQVSRLPSVLTKRVPIWVLLVTLVVLAVCGVGWFLSWYPRASRWGDIPGWIEALSTLAAVIAALWAGRAVYRQLRIEQGREADRLESARRAFQADDIAGWAVDDASLRRRVKFGNVDSSIQSGAKVVNGSRLPVYEVEVLFIGLPGNNTIDRIKQTVLPPGQKTYREPEIVRAATSDPLKTPKPASERFAVGLRFVDSAGDRWLRDQDGRLKFQGHAYRLTLQD